MGVLEWPSVYNKFRKKLMKDFEFRDLMNTDKNTQTQTWEKNYGFRNKHFSMRTQKVLVIKVWRLFTAVVLKILLQEVNCLVKDPFRKLTTHSLGKRGAQWRSG